MSGLSVFLGAEGSSYCDSLADSGFIPKRSAKETQAKETFASTKTQLADFLDIRLFRGTRQQPEDPPHIEDTIHTARSISAVDLRASSVQIDLSPVQHVTKLRRTDRPQQFEFDGPLASIYSYVISFEIHESQVSKVQQMAKNLLNFKKKRRMRIFLYDAYAKHVHYLFQSLGKDESLQLRIKAPAACIFPYSKADFYDTSPVCIAIGGEPTRELPPKLPLLSSPGRLSFDAEPERLHLEFMVGDVTPKVLQRHQGVAQLLSGATAVRPPQQQEPAQPSTPPPANKRRPTDNPPPSSQRKRHRPDGRKFCLLEDIQFLFQTDKLIQQTTGEKPSQRVNVICAVLSFTQPFRTKRGDWMMSVAVVDDSIQLCENSVGDDAFVLSVNVNIFVRGREKVRLPKILRAGDIVALENVDVQKWKDDLQLLGTRNSSYAVYRPGVTSVTGWDRTRMHELWQWAQNRLFLHATMKISHRFQISDVKMPGDQDMVSYGDDNVSGDLTALVTAIIPLESQRNSVLPKGFLRVWDGTGPPLSDPLPAASAAATEAVRLGDPPVDTLVKIAKIVQEVGERRNNPDLKAPKQLTGRVANVAVWEAEHWEAITSGNVGLGSFVRMRNIQDSKLLVRMHADPVLAQDLRCLQVYSKSSLTPLPDLTYEVVHLLEQHNNRLIRNDPTNKDSAVLPLEYNDSRDSAFDAELTRLTSPVRTQRAATSSPERGIRFRACSSLKILLTSGDFLEFRGALRIVGLLPSLAFLQSSGGHLGQICPFDRDSETQFYQFGVRLSQDDSSVVVDAIVSDDNGRRVGQTIMGTLASAAVAKGEDVFLRLRGLLENKPVWNTRIRSVVHEGKKFFVVMSMKLDEE